MVFEISALSSSVVCSSRKELAMVLVALVTTACSWYGHSSAPGTTIYLKKSRVSHGCSHAPCLPYHFY
jgi:hypothetical protein